MDARDVMEEIAIIIDKNRDDTKDIKNWYGTDSMEDTYDEGFCDATLKLCGVIQTVLDRFDPDK